MEELELLHGERGQTTEERALEADLDLYSASMRTATLQRPSRASACAAMKGPFERAGAEPGFVEVHLQSAGAEPRSTLGYRPAAGGTGHLAVVLQYTMFQHEVPSCVTPTIRVELAHRTDVPSPTEPARVTFRATRTLVLPFGNDTLHAAVEARLKDFAFDAAIEVDSRGFVCGTRYSTVDAPGSGSAQLARDLAFLLPDLLAPLPSEPVGAGAVWVVHASRAPGLVTRATYTLVSQDERSAELLRWSWTIAPPSRLGEPWPPDLDCARGAWDADAADPIPLGLELDYLDRGSFRVDFERFDSQIGFRRYMTFRRSGAALGRREANFQTLDLTP